MRTTALVTCMLLSATVLAAAPRGDGEAAQPIHFDFESGVQGWEVVEGSFGRFRCDRPLWYHNKTFGKEGKHFLSTIETPAGPWDNGLTGVAESPVFIPAGPDMSFLTGGGAKPNVFIALCLVDGTVLARAGGRNTEQMARVEWRVPEAVGKRVVLRLVDNHTGSYGWMIFDDLRATGAIDAEATRERRTRLVAQRELYGPILARRPSVDLDPLQAVIDDLAATFPGRFSQADALLERLATYRRGLARVDERLKGSLSRKQSEEAVRLLDAAVAFQREVAVANPLVGDRPLLFVVRHQYAVDHHNTETIFHTDEPNVGKYQPGGALKVIDLRTGKAKTLVDPGPEGALRDPEVHASGTRIVFAMRRARDENYHIYEVGADGSGLRQLTSEPEVTDIDPLYLPDGAIVFSSTREPKYCMCNMHIMANLYRMEGDGANIHQIGRSTLFEGHSALLPDGRILYYRWEYVDRNFGDAQGLWTVNPDGTNHAVYWGNNTPSPGAVFDARAIPGTQRVVCIFGSCHDRPWGAMAILDRRLGIDVTAGARRPVVRTWPAAARKQVGVGNWDAFQPVSPRYEDPYPLADAATGRGAGRYFLVSRGTGKGRLDARGGGVMQMGVYLVDVFGNETLLHVEDPGCFDPMPLGPTPRAPVIPTRRAFGGEAGRLYVDDVYTGTHMAGVARGEVTHLRVVESREKRFWTEPLWRTGMAPGSSLNRPAVGWVGFECKRILGTVPVEPDGSAYFEVPPDTFVYFQLLDRNGMMVASMRSGTMVQPGEATGCVGCHEPRLGAPPRREQGTAPLAARRPASRLTGWHGHSEPFSYTRDVQPVFDRHCVRCHDFGKPAGEKLVLAGDKTLFFNASYHSLYQGWRTEKALIDPLGAGPAEVLPAYSWGSHRSRMIKVLRAGHNEIALARDEMDRITSWIDISGPYYPDYGCAYPANLVGRSPLDDAQLARLGKLTGVNFPAAASYSANRGAQVCFDRPELSPCLAKLRDTAPPAYGEALAIIRAGQTMLAEKPRNDMAGFRYCAEHERRQRRYERLQTDEQHRRLAIASGARAYDVPRRGDESATDGRRSRGHPPP